MCLREKKRRREGSESHNDSKRIAAQREDLSDISLILSPSAPCYRAGGRREFLFDFIFIWVSSWIIIYLFAPPLVSGRGAVK